MNTLFQIDPSLIKPNIPKTIRFTEHLNTQLIELAKGKNISFNELVLRCCAYALKHYDKDADLTKQGETDDD